MDSTIFFEIIKQVGFNGALVVVLLFFGGRFLEKLLNHISHMQAEMEKHTVLLSQLLEVTRNGKNRG